MRCVPCGREDTAVCSESSLSRVAAGRPGAAGLGPLGPRPSILGPAVGAQTALHQMSRLSPHSLMAAMFSAMAMPCLTHPDLVSRLFLTGGALTPRERLLLRCFGSQALLTGISIGIGRWDANAYKLWAAAIVPFFAFDAAAYAGGFLTTAGAVGDAAGNAVFLALSYLAAKRLA